MAVANLLPEATRRQSPPVFVTLSFLLSHEPNLDPSTQVFGSDGSPRQLHTLVLLRSPCAMCRPVLQCMIASPNSSQLCQPMIDYLRGRLKMEDALGRSYVQPDLSFCTNDFVRRAYSPNVWDVASTRSINMAEQGQSFSPLAFNVALNLDYSSSMIPAGGYSVTEAVRLGVLTYEFYAALDRK
eukprot:scaffold6798_cov95-Cylindrotheca_fusiformis.AAC.1